jgi:hypothetical protein
MEICLHDLPNEILEIIIFYFIGRPWKRDVKDFLSFTSTCRLFHRFARDERYWQMMVSRRDPTSNKPPESFSWLEYCKQSKRFLKENLSFFFSKLVYSMRTIPVDGCTSRYNDDYFCTIEKVLIWPNKIRVYINERGDNSLG